MLGYTRVFAQQIVTITVQPALCYLTGVLHFQSSRCSVSRIGVGFFADVFALFIELFKDLFWKEYLTPDFELVRKFFTLDF